MPTQQISVGVVTTIAQNAVIAAPARLTQLFASVAIQSSFDGTAFSADIAASAVAPGIICDFPFFRCATGTSIVVCKPY